MAPFSTEAYDLKYNDNFEEAINAMNYKPFKGFDDFWRSFINKDQKAWEVMSQQFGQLLFYYLIKRNINELDAEDIIQEMAIKIWKKLSKDDSEDKSDQRKAMSLLIEEPNEKKFISYLITTAERLNIDRLRRSMSKFFTIEIDSDFKDEEIRNQLIIQYDNDPTVAQKVIDWVDERLRIYTENDTHINIFKTFVFESKTSETIAKQYKVSEMNVRVVVSRLKKFIIKEMHRL